MSEQVRRKLKAAMQENARLQAECQARQAENSVLAVECDSLKAEVERLTPLLGDIVSFDEYHKLLQQVERLTKAGDEMHEQATNTFQPISLRLAMEAWEAAKKGGQP